MAPRDRVTPSPDENGSFELRGPAFVRGTTEMMEPHPDLARIRADFDRIALLPGNGCNGTDHNARYHGYLLRHVPRDCERALDIGSGGAAFARALAARARRVVGIDLSPNMVRVARERSRGFSNIEYHVADAMTHDPGEGTFDCVASIAALHHLPVAALLPRLVRALRPGGVMLILDLRQSRGPLDRALDCAAGASSLFYTLFKARGVRGDGYADARRAWREHGTTDRYLTMPQVRSLYGAFMPGAVIRRHVYWRYSVVWRKAAAAGVT